MLKVKRWIPFLAVLVVFFLQYQRSPSTPTVEDPGRGSSPRQAPSAEAVLSDRQIEVDEEHIFEGEINRRGRPVGFHSRPGGREPDGARVARVMDSPNTHGVYTARVEVFDRESGQWLEKRSSFFPNSLDRGQVLVVIRHAYANRTMEDGDRWRGPSGKGFQVEGYLLGRRINTAYPLYR